MAVPSMHGGVVVIAYLMMQLIAYVLDSYYGIRYAVLHYNAELDAPWLICSCLYILKSTIVQNSWRNKYSISEELPNAYRTVSDCVPCNYTSVFMSACIQSLNTPLFMIRSD